MVRKVALSPQTKWISMDREEESLNDIDETDDPTDIILDQDKPDFKYTIPIEFLKSTRENFMMWKDDDY